MSRLTCLNLIQDFRNEVARLELLGSPKFELVKKELRNLIYKYGKIKDPVLLQIACDSTRFLSALDLGIVIYKTEEMEIPRTTEICTLFLRCLSSIDENFSEKNIEELDFVAQELEEFKRILKDFIVANHLTFYEQDIIFKKIKKIQYLLIIESYRLGETIPSYKDTIELREEEVASFLFDAINNMLSNKELKDKRLLSLFDDERLKLKIESRNIDIMFRLYAEAIKSINGVEEDKNSVLNNVSVSMTDIIPPVVPQDKMTFLKMLYGSEDKPKVKLEYCVGNYIRRREVIVSPRHYNFNFNGNELEEHEGYHCRLVTSFINKNMQYVVITENLYGLYLKESLEKFKIMLFQRKHGIKVGYCEEYLSVVHNDSIIKELYIEEIGISVFFEIYNGELMEIRIESDYVYYIDEQVYKSVDNFKKDSKDYISRSRYVHDGSIRMDEDYYSGRVHDMGISGSSGEFYYTYDGNIHDGNGKEIRKKLRPDGKFDTLEGNRKNCEMINPVSRVDENLEDGIPGVICRTYLVSKNLNPEEVPIVKQLK